MSDAVDTTVQLHLIGGMRFDAQGTDGLTLPLDSDAIHGGSGGGYRPMELLLVGLGGCAGMDVISILRKKRQQVTEYHIEVSGVQAEAYPHIYTEIAIRHTLHGHDLSPNAVQRSIELSEAKYCAAYAMLHQSARITSSFEIHPAAPAD